MRFVLVLLGVLCLGLAVYGPPAAGEPPAKRVPGTLRIRGDPDGLGQYEIVRAFPNLRFNKPLYVGAPPDGTDRLFVLQQDGVVSWFENRRDVRQAVTALDIRHKVYRRHSEEGLLGLAFHPDFKRNRHLFLHYSANNPRRGVISRFTMDRKGRVIRPKTERVILEQRQPWGNHNGGGLEFGPDGYLYITFGDGGAANDPLGSGQDLGTWLGSMLRIDVDRGRPYAVPKDNPFVGRKGAKPEIWAYGLRNVWRFSFDRVTGEMWGGDVGQVKWEEIDIIRKGGNYGWNVMEGHYPFKSRPFEGPLLDPVISLDRREARSITGGYVYRGTRLPDLVGAYIYADYETANVWALRWNGEKVVTNTLIGRGRNIASFGEDADGEIYIASFDGSIYTLAPGRGAKSPMQFPHRLSETGLFADMKRMTPHPSLIGYEVNAPLWSDGADKERFVMIPDLDEIRVGADGRYEFPVGTIFVKTFLVGRERLETRLLLRRNHGWAGFTYVWNVEQTEATLIDARVDKPLSPAAARKMKTSHWTYPGRSDCMACHTSAAGFVLGFRSEQLDRLVAAGKSQVNQLDQLARIGLFDTKPRTRAAWPRWDDESAPLDKRVRAYLDSNCANCHQPGAPGNATIDLRYEIPLSKTRMLNALPGQGDLGVKGAKILMPGSPDGSLLYLRMERTDEKGMPNLAHNIPDKKALRDVAKWIRGL